MDLVFLKILKWCGFISSSFLKGNQTKLFNFFLLMYKCQNYSLCLNHPYMHKKKYLKTPNVKETPFDNFQIQYL